jgi:hypothetical protein
MTRRRLLALVLVWTLPSLVLLAITTLVYRTYRIAPPARLDDAARTAVIATLRAALEDEAAVPCPVTTPVEGAAVVTVWWNGREALRVEGRGAHVGAAIEDASQKLLELGPSRKLSKRARAQARIQVDLVTGRAPLGGLGHLGLPVLPDLLAVNPGIEGIGLERDEHRALLLPHELVAAKVLTSARPVEDAIPELAFGLDLRRIRTMLATRSGLSPDVVAGSELFRFRTDTFVERPVDQRPGAPLPLYRGIPAAPRASAQALREAALQGGRFLVAHLASNGRYIYEHDLSTGRRTDPRSNAYSMPRHAGTTYFLAELYRITKEEWLREPIERAFAHLAELLATGRCGATLPDGTEIDCVLDRAEPVAQLGSTALAVVALVEYQRATGDTRYLPLATKFTSWILYMQRPDGSFRHVYDPATRRPDEKKELFYYTGEAALALARMHLVTGDTRYAQAAEKALDWLVRWYDFFMGGFFYGEEHWTCIAAEALYPAVKKQSYVDFCHGYGRFLRAQQPERGEFPDQDDWVGAYNFTSFVAPYNTPAGSRTEAMISAYLLGKYHGTPDAAVRDQIRAALQYTLGQQIRPDNDFNVIGAGLGGMPGSPIDRNVRIDYVQHVCSAMIRASEVPELADP